MHSFIAEVFSGAKGRRADGRKKDTVMHRYRKNNNALLWEKSKSGFLYPKPDFGFLSLYPPSGLISDQ